MRNVFITRYSTAICFNRGAIIIRSYPDVAGSTVLMQAVKHYMFLLLTFPLFQFTMHLPEFSCTTEQQYIFIYQTTFEST